MERRQRPMNRSREEGVRFSFRLQFQATGISKSEWDGLILSLVSAETGKLAAKTPRVLVRDGGCLWPEPIVESIKLAPDPLTGKYAEKLYKIIIQTGQVSILGDTTINLADYIDAKSQISISLPLKNCNAGTYLHVNVQCLTPRTGSRELQRHRVGNSDQDIYGWASEDNSSCSDVSETLSAGSSSSQKVSGWTNGSRQMKTSPTGSTISKVIDTGYTGSSFSKDGYPKIDVIPALDISNGNVDSHLGLTESRSFVSDSQKLEAAERTIQKLREEVSLREQWAQKMVIEVGSLKQQLISELKHVEDLRVEILAKNAECETLRSQLEHQKHFKESPKDYYSRWGLDDSRRQIDILEDELKYVKQLNADLQSRLNKANDANVEFIALVQELEDSLNVKDDEVRKLEEQNEHLLKELVQLQDSQGGYKPMYDADENIHMYDVSHWQQKLRAAETLLIDKEQEIKFLELKLGSCSVDLDGDHGTKDKQCIDLDGDNGTKDKLCIEMQSPIDIGINSISNTIKDDVSSNDKLWDVANDEATDKHLKVLFSEVDRKDDILEARINDSMYDSRHDLSKMAKGDLQKNMGEPQYTAAEEKLEVLTQELETLRNTIKSISVSKVKLEKSNLELSDSKIELEKCNSEHLDEISQLKEVNAGLFAKVSDLDSQLTIVKKERDFYKQEIEILNQNLERDLESCHFHLEKQLQDKTSECIQMQEKMEDQAKQHQKELDLKENELRREIQYLLSQKTSLEHRAVFAEKASLGLQEEKNEEVNSLKNVIEHLTLSKNEKEKTILEIEELRLEKTKLDNSLQEMEKASKILENRLISERMASDIKVSEISEKLDVSVSSCSFLTEKLESLQQQFTIQENEKKDFLHKIETLEKEVQDNVDAFSIMEQKLLEVQDVAKSCKQLQERCKELEDDAKANKEQLTNCERRFAQKETELCRRIECLESINEQLAAGTVDSGADQLKNELIRLQTQNAFLSRREQELISAMRTQRLLEEELLRLQECNDLLEARLSKFIETARNPFLLEKIVNLETELAEVAEASNMYKQQLKSVLDEQQNALDQAELYKMENRKLREELHTIHERYTIVSLKLAEMEAERSELQRRIRKNVNN